MKYITIIALSLLLTSCGSAYLANKVEKQLKGDWVLEEVSFPNSSGFFDATIFDLAEVSCFENSLWSFVPNNATGDFILDGNACDKQEQDFVWYIDKQSAESSTPELLFKITTNQKAKAVDKGSRVSIKSMLEDQMVWQQKVNLENKEVIIEMTFSKQ
jgi:hypothetical protein